MAENPDVKIAVYPVDIQDYATVDAAVEAVVSEIGPIDILINNVSNFMFLNREKKLLPNSSQSMQNWKGNQQFC